MFSYLDFRCHFKANAQNHIHFPVILGSPYKEEEEVPLITIHSFRHNLLHYYRVGDQASVEVEGVEEQMLIFSSSLTPGQRLLNRINLKDSCVSSIW